MAIALTPFEGLCGFRLLQDIKKNLKEYPEIINVIGKDAVNEFYKTIGDGSISKKRLHIFNKRYNKKMKKALKRIYRSLMEQDQNIVKDQLSKLIHAYLLKIQIQLKEH